MAFESANMVLMAHGANFKAYKYESTSDSLATIEADDYFDGYFDQLRVGDVLTVKGSDGSRMYTVTTSSSSAVLVTPFEGQNKVFAHDSTTSMNVPNSGVVTFTPTTVLSGTFEIASAPYPGATLTLVDLDGTTSIAVLVVGATTSVITFGQGTNNKLQLITFGAVELIGLSTTKWGVRGISNTDVTTSHADVQFLN